MPTSSETGGQLLAAVLDTALDAVVVMRSDGTIAAWNQIAQRMFGWSAAEAMGQDLGDLIIPERLRAAHKAGLDRFLRAGEVGILGRQIETVALKKDGSEMPVELAVMLTGRFQEILFLGFIRDISARKADEQKIAELQADLIHMSRVSAMGAMASTVAHELNQPLAAISNYLAACEMALKSETPDIAKLAELVGSARQNTTRAGQIVRRLRNMTVKSKSVRERFDVGEAIEEAANIALIGPEGRDVRRAVRCEPGLFVQVDRVQLQQVLINLVRNAVEAMQGSERKQLSIAAYRTNEEVRIDVRDTGSGLSAEMREALITPSGIPKQEKMGIGLSVSRMIIEAQHGRLWAEDPAEGGACLSIAIPAAKD
ncbi:sensor histidine kinase [Sphingosinicella sp. BN140058]|uniref:sensor histidine kinase n=1 Tax=Sphingosinicella sp. BN140058 TaxID=1892855 RepID=UPI0010121336|nr:PAS domain S-box protein [Sphingosinicella sp. BN140058]QAY77276.1 PAS domain S-box protein [Sphingosinicella sp. BN140058]